MTLSLFGAGAFRLSARAFSFRAFTLSLLGLFGACLNFVEVLVVSEVNDRDDRRAESDPYSLEAAR